MYTIEQIVPIIQAVKTKIPDWIIESRAYAKTLRALVTGEKFDDELSQIEHIEKSSEKWKARKKYAKSIKDLCERVLRPLDNVYSATGESKYFNLKSDADKELIIKKLGNVRDTKSLKKWLEDNWKQVYITDPNGLIFIEYKGAEICYPTYKSIESLRYYEANGQNTKFVIFEPEQTKEGNLIWRFVDDTNDLRFLDQNNSFTLIPELSFSHPFGFCPGVINSNIIKIGTDQRLSFIEKVIDLLQTFLRDQSILLMVKFLNGFKTLIRPRIMCHCHGTQNTGQEICSDCKGTGFLIQRDPTDEIIWPINLDNPDIKIPDAAGFAAYIGLDVETWNQYNTELEKLETKIIDTLWGSKKEVAATQQKTQLEIWANTQPVIIALNKVSDVAEWVDWQISELIINFYIPGKAKQEKSCSVNYGKNFILDPPEIILERLSESQKVGNPIIIRDRQLNELITTKFRNDVEQLNIEMKKKELEPYLYFTLKEVKETLGVDEAIRKMLYYDWVKTLGYSDFDSDREKLQKDFDNFYNDKLKQIKSQKDEEISTSEISEIPLQ